MTMYPQKNFNGPAPVFNPPMKASEIPEEWFLDVRKIIERDGHAVRAKGDISIEVKSLTTNAWYILGLPNLSGKFVSKEDRDDVLAKLIGK